MLLFLHSHPAAGKQYGADYVQAEFTLSQIDGFSLKCPGATVNSADAWVTITTFVTSVPTSFPYGGVTYPASPGAAKFNVELSAWSVSAAVLQMMS
jgi:hypothetical protein